MRIIVLSDPTVREWLPVQEILRSFEDVIWVKLDKTHKKGSNGRKRNKGFKYVSNGIFRRLKVRRLEKMLQPHIDQKLREKFISLPIDLINQDEGKELLKSLNPDILVTCRCPILNEALFDIPKIAAINIHYGISPHYRGNDTLFWAYLNGDFEKLGGCIHYLSKGVDTGNILAEVYPDLEKWDGEAALDVKTTLLLSKTVVKVIRDLGIMEKRPIGKAQLVKGKNYKIANRTSAANFKYLFKNIFRINSPQPRDERTEFFY